MTSFVNYGESFWLLGRTQVHLVHWIGMKFKRRRLGIGIAYFHLHSETVSLTMECTR